MSAAGVILMLTKLWLWIGGAVAVPFLIFGIDRLDEDARGAYVFRPLLVPGILLLWPLVLWRWYVLGTGRDQWALRHQPRRDNHKWVALAMPLAIVVIIGAGLSVRQSPPTDIAPVLLELPDEVSQ